MNKTIGIFAHVDGGKTTFSEQILYHTNSIRKRGRVDHKDSFLDSHDIEKKRGITVFSDVAKFDFNKDTYFLVDTPGHIDFSKEMERGIGILDYAILIISGRDGVEGHTETIWNSLRKHNVPTFIFINKMDLVLDSIENTIKTIERDLNTKILLIDDLDKLSEENIEFIAEKDEELLNIYFEEGYNKKLWIEKLKMLIKNNKIVVCSKGVALLDEGITEFLEIFSKLTFTDYESEGQFKGRVFKVRYDNKGNRVTFIKGIIGKLKTKDEIKYTVNGETIIEKVNSIRSYNGNKFEGVDFGNAGEIFGVVGITKLTEGMGINTDDCVINDLRPALISKVIYNNKINDKEVLNYFKILESEDESLNVNWNEELKELHISIMGKIQLEVLKEVILERFSLNVEFGEPEILYKETIEGETFGYGHFEPLGHYSEVHLKIEEGDRDSGITFYNKCHADNLTTGNQNLIKTHIFEREHKGILTGSPITDLKITLLTGRAHNKHTSGGDFRESTKRALRQGLESAKCKLLEPYYKFKITIPIELIGRVISDIQKMSGEFNEPWNLGDRVIITGRGPVKTLMNYPLEFVGFTKGKGNINLVFEGYDLCHNEEEVIENKGYSKDSDIEYTSVSIFCSKGQSYLVEGKVAKEYMHCLK
ncbi:translation factor GTPase family protein [Clostridium sp.]|uniref:translation factor GTPase family protein n=1 Tax=Clostridium sp. TaxID=1506 RepID=UPI002FC9F848